MSQEQESEKITRAMAVGHIAPSSWLIVLRHELLMGLALGLTLGAIGFVAAYRKRTGLAIAVLVSLAASVLRRHAQNEK